MIDHAGLIVLRERRIDRQRHQSLPYVLRVRPVTSSEARLREEAELVGRYVVNLSPDGSIAQGSDDHISILDLYGIQMTCVDRSRQSSGRSDYGIVDERLVVAVGDLIASC